MTLSYAECVVLSETQIPNTIKIAMGLGHGSSLSLTPFKLCIKLEEEYWTQWFFADDSLSYKEYVTYMTNKSLKPLEK